jgi:hypothetical protein
MRVLQDAFGGNGRRMPLQAGCAGAAEHRAEQDVQAAQVGLGRAPVIDVISSMVVMIVLRMRLCGQAFVKVPDRVRERAMLRGEQREDASQLQ